MQVFDRLKRRLRLSTVDTNSGYTREEISDSIAELQKSWTETALFVLDSFQTPDVAVLGMTSSVEGEGKSTACLGLGVALAREIEGKVLIVECEAGNSGISGLFGLEPEPGLIEFIEQPPVEMERILRRTTLPSLDVVTIGGSRQEGPSSDSENLLTSSRIRRYLPTMVTHYRDHYEFILLDLPPLTRNAYALDLSRKADKIFLSVKTDVTPLEQMSVAMDMVEDDKLVALLLLMGPKRALSALMPGTARRESVPKIIEIPELPPVQDKEALLKSALMGTQLENIHFLDRTVRV